MSQELCFYIEGRNLYLEQVLVEYMNIPIFFLCEDEQQHYLVLCTDIDNFNYIIVKLSMSDLYKLLHGNIPMRDVFLKQKEYWDVISKETISKDTVVKHEIDHLDHSLLPKENAYLRVLTGDLKTFIQNLDTILKS